MDKSPFYIVEEFLSPLLCEEVIDICGFTIPNTDVEGNYVKTMKSCERAEAIIYERLLLLLPELQAYYQFLYKGTEPVNFEMIPEGSRGEVSCENSNFIRGKWLRTRQRDFTGILFLCDYQDKTPFEQDFEVYGGKLEFPQHHFGFNPRRGTLVVFPSGPHFINNTADIFAGDLYQARIQIAAKDPWLYDPREYPGNYLSWFANIK